LFALKNCAKGGGAAKNHGKSQAQNSRDLREPIKKEEHAMEREHSIQSYKGAEN